MPVAVKLRGGPDDGVVVEMWGVMTRTAELVPPTRRPTDDDEMIFDEFGFVRWADPALNPRYIHHQYDRDGRYVGAVEAES